MKPSRRLPAGPVPSTAPTVDRRPRLIPPHAPPVATPTESVEAFLARGGAIEQLDLGARGQPVLQPLHDRHESDWRNFKINRKSRDG